MAFRTQFRSKKDWLDSTNGCIDLNTPSDEAAKEYDAILNQLCGWYEDPSLGGVAGARERMLKADPDFILGRALDLQLDHMGMLASVRTDKQVRKKFEELNELVGRSERPANAQEKLHVEVVNSWANGELRKAANKLEQLATLFPEDVSALKMNQDLNFLMGTALPMRNSLAGCLPKMSAKNPLKSFAHGMLAFAFEESNMYELGQREALRSLELNPRDTWAIHNYAHCLEMQAKVEEGLRWMETRKADWAPCSMLACHQYWHTALFNINNNRFDDAVALLDDEVLTRCARNSTSLDLHDAASMVYRMELVDLFKKTSSPGDEASRAAKSQQRWACVYKVCEPHKTDHLAAFNDAHFLMSLLGAGDLKGARELIDSLDSGEHSYKPQLVPTLKALLEAMYSFKEGAFERSVELLEPVRHEIINIGGSHAQRDVFEQLLLVAALKSARVEHKKLGERIIQERESLHGRRTIQTELLAGVAAA